MSRLIRICALLFIRSAVHLGAGKLALTGHGTTIPDWRYHFQTA